MSLIKIPSHPYARRNEKVKNKEEVDVEELILSVIDNLTDEYRKPVASLLAEECRNADLNSKQIEESLMEFKESLNKEELLNELRKCFHKETAKEEKSETPKAFGVSLEEVMKPLTGEA